MQLLEKLIPGFEEKAYAADSLSSYCAPVSISILSDILTHLTLPSCNQEQMTLAAMTQDA
jgi:hypothetical protein